MGVKETDPESSFCKNGKIWYTEEFKDGIQHGVCKDYYNTGSLKNREEYQDGLEHGISIGYYEDGRVEYIGHYRYGELVDMGNFQLLKG